MDISAQIIGQYSKFSKSNKKIADYIVKYPEEVLNLSSIEIGEMSNTSASSVVRFAKTLGFSGIEEMKINVAKNVISLKEVKKLDPIILKEDSASVLTQKVSDIVIATTQSLSYSLNISNLEEAFKFLCKAKTIYLYGIGASGLAAYDLYHKLRRINVNAQYEMETHMSIEFSAYMTKKDVVVAFSYSGKTKEILIPARSAKERGAKLIVVTREEESPLSSIADIILNVPNNEHLLRIGAVASKFSSLLVSDLLFFGIVQNNFENIEKGLVETSRLTSHLKENK